MHRFYKVAVSVVIILWSKSTQAQNQFTEIGQGLRNRTLIDIASGDTLKLTSKLNNVLEGHFYCGSEHPLGRPNIAQKLAGIAQQEIFNMDLVGPVSEGGLGSNGWKVNDFSNYDLIIANNVTQITKEGCLTKTQQDGIQAYVEGGGSFFSIHATNDARAGSFWTWYSEEVITAGYTGHGSITNARVFKDPEAVEHWITRPLPNEDIWGDEYFNYQIDVKDLLDVEVLMHVDDNSFDCGCPGFSSGNHAIQWIRKIGAGKVLFALNGHDDKIGNTAQEHWDTFLTRGMYWMAGWDTTLVQKVTKIKNADPFGNIKFNEKKKSLYLPDSRIYNVKLYSVHGDLILNESVTGPQENGYSDLVARGIFFLKVSNLNGRVYQFRFLNL